MTAAGRVCTAIKRLTPEQKVMLIGGHVTALPERTLAEEDADFVAAGEGLHTLVDLVEALKTPCPDLKQVPGLWRREADRPCVTPDRPLVADLGADAGSGVGPLADDRYRAPQLALPRRPRPPTLRRHLHNARMPFPLFLLLHPGAVSRPASERAACGKRATAIAIGAWMRFSRKSMYSFSATAFGISRSPMKCLC